jgi:hypothetical protein
MERRKRGKNDCLAEKDGAGIPNPVLIPEKGRIWILSGVELK